MNLMHLRIFFVDKKDLDDICFVLFKMLSQNLILHIIAYLTD